MDEAARTHATDEIESRLLMRQRNHIQDLERLESDFGLDLDVLTEIFGESVLNTQNPIAADVKAGFEKIFDAFSSGNSSGLFVSRRYRVLRPGCYGFGQKSKYDVKRKAVLFDSTGQVRLEYRKGTDEALPQIVLIGRGVILSDFEDELPTIRKVDRDKNTPGEPPITDFSAVEFPIAGVEVILGSSSPFMSMDEVISEDNVGRMSDVYKLYRNGSSSVERWMECYSSEHYLRVMLSKDVLKSPL